MTYDAQYSQYRDLINAALAVAIDASPAPEPLRAAMRYSLLAGGKRLRPVLLLAFCEMGGGAASAALPYACALEMIHTYSLIHDDLPAMDDDDLRRGHPTNHKVYGEGIAVLAGDGLLSLAFETMLSHARTPAHIRAMRAIAAAAGVGGMLAGQCLDLTCEREKRGGAEEVAYIHRHKTADLFIGAAVAGLSLADAPDALCRAGETFAEALGLAFQIQDDLLDAEGDATALGKATGMDAARGKLTWPGVFGAESAHAAVAEQTARAQAALAPFGLRADFIREMADRLLARDR